MKPKLEVKLGADPKRVGILVALLALAGYLFYTNVWYSTDASPAPSTRPSSAPPAKGLAAALQQRVEDATKSPDTPRPPSTAKERPREFRPSLVPKKGEERAALATLDPTLQTDILTKLAAVKIERVDRSLFEFGAGANIPKPGEVKPKLPEPKIVPQVKFIGPLPPPPPPTTAPKPPPPPINLKFYGASLPTKAGVKRVFCMQGDEVLTPSEGDLVQKRYRIVRINPTSVVVEDTEFKNQQTLPIEEVPKSS
jgi:hypothetical protein